MTRMTDIALALVATFVVAPQILKAEDHDSGDCETFLEYIQNEYEHFAAIGQGAVYYYFEHEQIHWKIVAMENRLADMNPADPDYALLEQMVDDINDYYLAGAGDKAYYPPVGGYWQQGENFYQAGLDNLEEAWFDFNWGHYLWGTYGGFESDYTQHWNACYAHCEAEMTQGNFTAAIQKYNMACNELDSALEVYAAYELAFGG